MSERRQTTRRQQDAPIEVERRQRYVDRRVDLEDVRLSQQARRLEDDIRRGERRLLVAFVTAALVALIVAVWLS